jgi:hypothetical protein
MPALIFGLGLLHLIVYAEAAVIVVLAVIAVWLYIEAVRLFDLNEEARGTCAEVHRTLQAIQHMKKLRRETAERMARADEQSWR